MTDLNTDGKSGGGGEEDNDQHSSETGSEWKGRERIWQNLFHLSIVIDLCNKQVREAVGRRAYAIYWSLESEVKR